MTEEDKKYYNEYREKLQTVVDKSEDDFETRLLHIASGALALSFTFISDIVKIDKSSALWLLFVGWALLIICVLVNLLSNISSKNKANKMIDSIDDFLNSEEEDNTELRNRINRMNKSTNCINIFTVTCLILGIISVVFFASYNMYKENSNQDKKELCKVKKDHLIHKNEWIVKNQRLIIYLGENQYQK